MAMDDKLSGARRWYPFSENESVLIVNGPVVLSGGEMLAAMPPVRTSQIWILDVGVPSANNSPSGCMPSVVSESSNAAEWYTCVKPNNLWSKYILLRDNSTTSVNVGCTPRPHESPL